MEGTPLPCETLSLAYNISTKEGIDSFKCFME
jgi:hypothetical protein